MVRLMTFKLVDWVDSFGREYKMVTGDEKGERAEQKVYLILLTYNCDDYLEKCIKATKKQVKGVYALDNGSNDGTIETLKTLGVDYITSKKKGDLSYLMNKNLKRVPTDGWCFYVNPDEILFDLPNNFISKYCSFLHRLEVFASDVRFPDFVYNYSTLFSGFCWGEEPGVYWTARRLFRYTGAERFRGRTHYNVSNLHPGQRHAPLPNNEHTGMWGGTVAKTELVALFHYGKCRGVEKQRGKGERLIDGDLLARGLIPTRPYFGSHPSVMEL